MHLPSDDYRIKDRRLRLWEQIVHDQPGLQSLPPIMPILIHHSDTGWTAATSFHEIIAGEGPERAALLPHIPSFAVRLVDVSGGRAGDPCGSDADVPGEAGAVGLSVAGDDARLEQEITRFGEALDEVLRAPSGPAALEVLTDAARETACSLRRRWVNVVEC